MIGANLAGAQRKESELVDEAAQATEPDRSEIHLTIPSIKLVLSANKNELNAELEELDPYDAGIFSRKDSPIDNWKIVAACSKVEIVQSRTKFVSDLSIKLNGLKVKEEANDVIRISGKN